MKKPTKVKKPLSPKMRKHLKRMHEAAQLAAAKRRKAKKVTQPKKAAKPEPVKKRKKAVKVDLCQLELPLVADLALPAADDGSEPASSPAVDASEAPQPGEELL